jgi:hypothetical protein
MGRRPDPAALKREVAAADRHRRPAVAGEFACPGSDPKGRGQGLRVRTSPDLPAGPQEDLAMHMVIRTYTGPGAKELFDLLQERAADVESVMRSVKGFLSYTLARSHDGGVAVTVCENFAGAMESLQKAKEWVAKNAAHTGVGPPKASDGVVIVHASAK